MRRTLIAAALCLLAALPAAAQPRIINGFAPGGTADTLTRLVAEYTAGPFGQRAVVENRTGANGFIAAEMVARGPTDGSMVGLCVLGMVAITPEMPNARLPIDPRQDFAGVALIALSPYGVVTAGNSPHRSFADLLAAARSRPNAVSYASVGVGSAPHLAGVLIGLRTGAEMVHVPYRGGAPAVLDVIAGRTDFIAVSLGDITRQIRSGELRLLALGDERPVAIFPEVRPISATLPGVQVYTWFGLCGPRTLSAEGRSRWERSVQAAIGDAELRARLEQMGLIPLFEDGPTMDRRIASDRALWGEVIRAANLGTQ